MKIGILSPSFPPKHCGVGDYTARLSLELARQGHSVKIWTAESGARAPDAGLVDVRVVPGPWGLNAYATLARLVARSGIDALLIQYTPTLYGQWGVRPELAPWIATVRTALRRPVVLVAHELHYPLGLTPDRLVLGSLQLTQTLALAAAAGRVICTYEAAANKMKTLLPWARPGISWLASGATIEPTAGGVVPAIPAEFPKASKLLLHFGSSHPSRLLQDCFSAVHDLNDQGEPAILALAGLSENELNDALSKRGSPGDAAKLRRFVLPLGYLAPADVSSWMARADLAVMPFIDGVSTRRTSAMAALAHGKTLATTRGWASAGEIRWEGFAGTAPAGDQAAFLALVKRLLGDANERKRLGESARREFERRFSWPMIADGVVRQLAR